jgi:prepilin-type N-terminal cleavage/methylation domain-containing protein
VERRSEGFTLLEVAVALAILGIGVVTLLQIFQGALRLQIRASERTRAILLVRETMDEIATLSAEESEGYCTGSNRPAGINCTIGPVCNQDIGLTPEQWEERGYPDCEEGLEDADEHARLYKVDVVATWQDAGGEKSFGARTFRYYNPELWDGRE